VKLTNAQKDKLITAAQNAIPFTVTPLAGTTAQFPADMLRYDLCWPATEQDSHLIEATLRQMGRYLDNVQINLRGLKPATLARWHSFGWTVVVPV